MKPDALPQACLLKLLQIDHDVTAAESSVADLTMQIKVAEQPRQQLMEVDQLRAHNDSLTDLYAKRQVAEKALAVARQVKQRVGTWIEALPAGTRLETVDVAVAKDRTVADTRRELGEAQQELRRLTSAPVPDGQLHQRIEKYVDGLVEHARPIIAGGISGGGAFAPLWPLRADANRANQDGFSATQASPLLMAAWLFRDQLIDRLHDETNATVDAVLPVAQRPGRIAELKQQIEALQYEEEALVSRDAVPRRADAPPAAVLGVRVVPQRQARAA